MIFCFTAFVGFIVYGLFVEPNPILAWSLLGLIAFLGGMWAAYDARMNGE